MLNEKGKFSSKYSKNQTKTVSFNKPSKSHKNDNLPVPDHLKAFSLSDLKIATKNFRPDSLLGEGGFGQVFKGWVDETTFAPAKPGTGLVIAVKILKADSRQGHREWLTELDYMGRLHHKNLVKLYGYCSESNNRLLVYEFMPKGCLDNHLFKKSVEPMPWATRMRIAIDVAEGLAFLHSQEPSIIYRDLKASNILLDTDFNAKLSDFGLARNGPEGDSTHVSTRVVGTNGYAAPEYIATGRRAIADERAGGVEETLVEWVKPFLHDSRRTLRIMDVRLGESVEPMPWATRMRIAIDVAEGLAFLHSQEPSIIYRDLKASNILLDTDFNAKLSDFGLARNGPEGDSTHVSTRVVGTNGYAAPEYIATGHLTPKNDVYSFGVVLLELLSGRRAIADERAGGVEETLVEWVKPFLHDSRRTLRIMDVRLGGQYSKKGAQAIAALASKCLHNDHRFRPTMTDVLASLKNIQNSQKEVPRISPDPEQRRSLM
uniref:non-specific serine/threonine protein kinase n=1 Tax=Tanacetum cinerariifolium TaxID=118510 RepID=A0A6L2M461_TANCI|nr:probable serine/threonine-protein kinase PBL3 [Tanacetum cinerariifolium]